MVRGIVGRIAMATAMTGLVSLGLVGCGTTEGEVAEPSGDGVTSVTNPSENESRPGGDDSKGTIRASEGSLWVPTRLIATSLDEKGNETPCEVTFSYDENGNCVSHRTSMNDGGDVVEWKSEYDGNGYASAEEFSITGGDALSLPLIGEVGIPFSSTSGTSFAMENEFDGEGRLVRMTQKAGEGDDAEDDRRAVWVSYGYDADGNLANVSNSDGYEYSYDEHGNVSSVSYEDRYGDVSGFTVSHEYSYGEDGLASGAIETTTGMTDENGKELPAETHEIAYERDGNGNIIKKTITSDEGDSVVVVEYEYELIEKPSAGALLYSHDHANFHRFYAD